MSLRKSKSVKFLDRNVVVWELDVRQVADFFAFVRDQARAAEEHLRRLREDPSAEPPKGWEPHALDILMGGKLPFVQVLQCVPELSEEDFTAPGVSASDIEPIWRAAEEVNPFLLRAGDKVVAAAQTAEQAAATRPRA